jgi:FPC/CPF motif-containing protein YcgG
MQALPEAAAPAETLTTMHEQVETAFREFVQRPEFPCLGAKSVVRLNNYQMRVYHALGTEGDAPAMVADLASFSADLTEGNMSAFIAVFPDSPPTSELEFERRLWKQLELVNEVDSYGLRWAEDVSADPEDPSFSYCVGGRAFFVVGLHRLSSRLARRFDWPALVFNPHEQFTLLREQGRFEGFRSAIRARDIALQGSENPNLADFGEQSEARQYSGRQTEGDWQCPFHRKQP